MMIVPTIIGIFIVALGLLRYTDRAPTEVSYVVTGELSRAAALVVPQQRCDNPLSVDTYEECVEAANMPLVPLDNPVSPHPLCWLALSQTAGHTRVKQCWTHDSTTKQITVSLHSPLSTPAPDATPLAITEWMPDPDSTTSAATGIEAWAWKPHLDDSGNVVLVQIDVCASLTDEERGRAHLAGLPRCDAKPNGTDLLFAPHPGCHLLTDQETDACVGVHLPPIFLAPGAA